MSKTFNQNAKNTKTKRPNEGFVIGRTSLAKDLWGDFHLTEDHLNEHFYIIGRSGSGKTNLLSELAIADIEAGRGLCFIDPIGTAAENLLSHVPTGRDSSDTGQVSCRACRRAKMGRALSRSSQLERDKEAYEQACGSYVETGEERSVINGEGQAAAHEEIDCTCGKPTGAAGAEAQAQNPSRDKDVIYIDCADTEFPIGINPLYNIAPEDRPRVVSDILQMFSNIWHDTGWGPRMESIFRAALHTLIENPNCMRPSLLSVFRLLLDEEFRKTAKTDIDNKQLLDWWNYRFDRHDLHERTRREWVEPVLNKIDALSLDPLIRNIIGQPRCTLDFDEIIRRKQILIVNLNQNKIGLDNASFIGILIIARIRQAAAKVGKREAPFSLSIDEAHCLPTMELTKIISQGRHTGLFARICHQHLDQFNPKISSILRNGCGSLAVFAVGHKDAETIVDDLEAQHRDRSLDIIRNLGQGEAMLRLTKNGKPNAPASTPINIRHREQGHAKPQSARNFTRERFATDRLTAEYQIAESMGDMTSDEHFMWRTKFEARKSLRAKTQKQNRTMRIKRKAEHLAQQTVHQDKHPSPKDELQELADLLFAATH